MQVNIEELKCPICMQIFENCTQTNCGHAFCAECILTSINHNKYCPICRSEIFSLYPSYNLRKIAEQAKNTHQELHPKENSQPPKFWDEKIKEFNQKNHRPNLGLAGIRYDYNILTRVMTQRCNSYSFAAWFVFLLVLAYLVWPYDLIPNTEGLFGFLDDFLILIWGIWALHKIVSYFEESQRNRPNRVNEIRQRMRELRERNQNNQNDRNNQNN
ncbi:e3 ubiquitin-protein ligase [Anaeramoeba ignava]|uniref:E3 ubiquitin-protein ligase RNF170 n=1 Tax=Anaeramoeba ignava TaxID=1746090 RepID=A0A9Q0R976_ANAIG|nr:e3 ubiquitin-protein ligase [Anaeramoeba ignava]|eukprot:Anaeramoba_ignava/c74767_g1_i1.p1 GENE.c74767_g1_i1~~c74767_g1_i1.p1  ORF type:complete len:215 (+),score=58.76 c74767_g1_i1:1-645(+)